MAGAATFTPDLSLLSMTTPLGPNELIPFKVRLEEAINRPYLCSIDVATARSAADLHGLLCQPVCLTMRPTGKGGGRKVHGQVRSVTETGPLERRFTGYRLEVVPTLWFMSQTEDCRIFEQKTTKEILETLCQEVGITDVTFHVTEADKRTDADKRTGADKRGLTVQYNETDLAFFTRLVEEEGWLFWFEHDSNRHKLLVAEDTAKFVEVDYSVVVRGTLEGPDTLAVWQPGCATAHGAIKLADYDPDNPKAEPAGVTNTQLKTTGAAAREQFHWPARAVNSDAIRGRTRKLMEAAEAESMLARGEGRNEDFVPGAKIRVQAGTSAAGAGQPYHVVGVVHEASDNTWLNAAQVPVYGNSFTALPGDRPWRPQPTVARPRMDGLHSAVVLGPEGEEIHTDELGRVKLQLRWDHRKDGSAAAGIWVRVVQGWAGPGYGWQAIPRVGTEVAVAFMDSDPDRPVVVGQLYNGEQKPPFPLQDHKTRTGLRTRSTPEGGTQGNELWFEDKKGDELVYAHATKDLSVDVKNDATYTIGQHRTATVTQGNDSLTVKQGNRSATVSSGNDSVVVEKGSRTVEVKLGNHTITSTAGNIAIKTTGGKIELEAMQSLTLKVGPSSVTIDPSGITLKGLKVQIEGQVLAGVKAPIVKLDAAGLAQLTGGVMMLN